MSRRGAILVEMVLALAIFVGAAMAISASVRGSLGSAIEMRSRIRAADLAASAMAQIEAGISTMRDLDGPIPVWEEPGADGMVSDAPPRMSEWSLEIASERSGVSGLTLVTVTASRTGEPGAAAPATRFDEPRGPSFTVHRLLRLARGVESDENPEDSISADLAPAAPGGGDP